MTYQILKNADCIITMKKAFEKKARHIYKDDLSEIHQGSLVINSLGMIEWIGPHKKLPKKYSSLKNAKEFSCKGQTLLPGFIECHTHTLFSGSRSQEFEMRLQGASYQEISSRGGGILSTVKSTRKATKESLIEETQKKVNEFVRQGVTTLEIKSGYALDLKNEIKSLEVISKLKGPEIVSTFLGAHSLPPEFKNYDEYLIFLANKVLPEVKKKKISRRVDIFIEKGFFSPESARAFLTQAKAMGFEVVIHADQLTLSGGADLAVELNAYSADHLIQIKDQQKAKSPVCCCRWPTYI